MVQGDERRHPCLRGLHGERDEVRQRPAGEAFRYEGDYWTLAFAGRLCRLRDAKGLHHIAHLLARPGEYIPATDLLMALDRGGVAVSGGSTNGTMAAPAGDAGPLLDGHAKNAYRRASSAAERARLTVTKRIKGVLERIASRHPPLAEHLGRTIRTGLLCAYIPDSDRTTHWSL